MTGNTCLWSLYRLAYCGHRRGPTAPQCERWARSARLPQQVSRIGPVHGIIDTVATKLQKPGWRFRSPGPIPDGVVNDFIDLIKTIAEQGPFQDILEGFKSRFAIGVSYQSSDASWAETDLHRDMQQAAANAPRFIAAFLDGCNDWAAEGKDVPDVDVVNDILANHNAGYQVDGDTVVATTEHLSAPQATAAPSIASSEPAVPLRGFLCHSSGDKAPVRELYKKLLADGFIPWLDEENLLPGQDWDAEIRKAVRNSHVVIVCLSKASTTKAGYVQKEIKVALDVADEQPDGTIFIIPLRLEECTVAERLKKWHWVDLFSPKGYQKLVAALKLRATDLHLT